MGVSLPLSRFLKNHAICHAKTPHGEQYLTQPPSIMISRRVWPMAHLGFFFLKWTEWCNALCSNVIRSLSVGRCLSCHRQKKMVIALVATRVHQKASCRFITDTATHGPNLGHSLFSAVERGCASLHPTKQTRRQAGTSNGTAQTWPFWRMLAHL